MPVCVSCAYPADHLYTTYKTQSNIRLGVCPRCGAFLEPLIEHPPLILLLDLILLKPRVFLHLLFNRGSTPLSAVDPRYDLEKAKEARNTVFRNDLIRLVAVTVVADTVVRSLPSITGNEVDFLVIGRNLGLVISELFAQHVVTVGLGYSLLRWRRWYPYVEKENKQERDQRDGRQEQFTPYLISLTLLYTSILPLLLLLFLSIWYTPSQSSQETIPSSSSVPSSAKLPHQVFDFIPEGILETTRQIAEEITRTWAGADRVWAGTRLLGGMSAGFGLRVLLPTNPWETTGVVLAGWMAAALIGRILVANTCNP